ncbi:ATP-binding protein [Aliamphritea spongicola]|uniref:ATP-binding protein n=1 Tax=Aliamphritea spongicola TaxID=707589 RepID=UPI00196B0D98|nr:HAMP domain-containing protein [Aliamphritea spongicola]
MTPAESATQPAERMQKGLVGTLNTRLSLALMFIVIAVGVAVMLVSQNWMRAYYEELTQKLNFSIAMYVTDTYSLITQNGDTARVQVDAIEALAQQAMVINPLAEVYLLDARGNILAHALQDDNLARRSIPLGPLQDFIRGDIEYPLRGADPRHMHAEKVFSAAEIRQNGQLQGYLYVILGGQLYDNIEDGIQDSYSRSMVLVAIAVITLAAILAGWLIFRLLVRRLGMLSQAMHSFSEQNLDHCRSDLQQPATAPLPKDEIDLLAQTFERMSEKIGMQFEMLREADQTRRELISNVSHDLRTPLSTIQGYLETLLIKNSSLNETERMEFLRTAMHSSHRLGQLIQDLFELSKLEAKQMSASCERFSLAELVFDTIQEFRLQAEAKNIHIEVVNLQNNAFVYADISLIQRVFENLLRNAVTYTPENGEIRLQIEADAARPQDAVSISIADNGQGISPEHLPYIFDRFYTQQQAKSTNTGSTGLGLAIVKRILELHSSEIEVQSQLNQGSCFRFSLQSAA